MIFGKRNAKSSSAAFSCSPDTRFYDKRAPVGHHEFKRCLPVLGNVALPRDKHTIKQRLVYLHRIYMRRAGLKRDSSCIGIPVMRERSISPESPTAPGSIPRPGAGCRPSASAAPDTFALLPPADGRLAAAGPALLDAAHPWALAPCPRPCRRVATTSADVALTLERRPRRCRGSSGATASTSTSGKRDPAQLHLPSSAAAQRGLLLPPPSRRHATSSIRRLEHLGPAELGEAVRMVARQPWRELQADRRRQAADRGFSGHPRPWDARPRGRRG